MAEPCVGLLSDCEPSAVGMASFATCAFDSRLQATSSESILSRHKFLRVTALDSRPLPEPKLVATSDVLSAGTDVLVLGVTDDGNLSASGQAVDDACGGLLGQFLKDKRFSGKRGRTHWMLTQRKQGDQQDAPMLVLLLGLGNRNKANRGLAFDAASTAVRALTDIHRDRITITLSEFFPDDPDAVVAGALFGCESQAIYQSDPGDHCPDHIQFTKVDDASLRRGSIIGRSINLTRRLVNEPAGTIYPETFCQRVTQWTAGGSLECEVWDESRLAKEGCRAMLAVGQGSTRPPRLLIMRHRGGGENEAPVALVGKGVTFDSGGLSIKPSDGMVDMKCDMAGAATVVGVMNAVSELGLRKNVIGFCGLAENMVSGDSYKLGDVIETRSGKTIEILNTDAEGRVVLADTLDVAIQHQPERMVDLATLTGACMVALGKEVAGLMTNHDTHCREIESAAKSEGEWVWELPMFGLYDEKVKSKVADIKNIGEGRWGGAITAAKFLENFVGDVPWVHMDIAGPAFADSPKPHRDAGASGVMVRTLIRWLES